MQQLRGQAAELQGQLGQQQPITMDQVRKLVEDELRKDERQKNLPKPRQPHNKRSGSNNGNDCDGARASAGSAKAAQPAAAEAEPPATSQQQLELSTRQHW